MALALGLTAASNVADIAGEGISRTLFGLASVIAESAKNVRFNSDAAVALSRRVNELVAVVGAELETADKGVPAAWRAGLENFSAVLEDTKRALEEQNRQSYLAQFVHRDRDAQTIKDLSLQLRQAFDILKLRAHINAQEQLDIITRAWGVLIPEVVAPVTEENVPATFIPPAAQFYFGRSAETQAAVDLLDRDGPTFLAILGGPGMGKTSLAVAVLHEPTIATRFDSRRYFVSCDAAGLGIAYQSRSSAQKALMSKFGGGASVLVLDNFESAWEAPSSRADAEETLSFLASVNGLSVIVTLRGSERPQGVSWTKPLLPPLGPLDDSSATQLFVTLSDVSDVNAESAELLRLVDNIPLALVLMANLSSYESSRELLSRWQTMKTSMLQRSDDTGRLMSLDVSIRLSLTSPRMVQQPEAVTLLSLLSLLPQGISQSDINLIASNLANPASALSCLLRTSLAVRTADDRIRVLCPIREYMLLHHAPSDAVLVPLYDHYFGIAGLIDKEGLPVSTAVAAAIEAVSPELENLCCVVQHALNHAPDPKAAVTATTCILDLLCDTGIGSTAPLQSALAAARNAQLDYLTGRLLYLWANLAFRSVTSGDPQALWTEALQLFKRVNDVEGILDTTAQLSNYLPPEQAIASCQEMRFLAESYGKPNRTVSALHKLSKAYYRAGRKDEAYECQEQVVKVQRSLEHPDNRMIGHSLAYMADFSIDAGNITRGVGQLKEAIPLFEESKYQTGLGEARTLLGSVLTQRGDLGPAIEELQAAARIFREQRVPFQEVWALHCLVTAQLARGNDEAGLEALHRAEQAIISCDDSPNRHARVLLTRGEVSFALGDLADARGALHAGLITARGEDRLTNPEEMLFMEGKILEVLAAVEQAEDNYDEAITCCIVAAAIFRKFFQATERLKTYSTRSYFLSHASGSGRRSQIWLYMPLVWPGREISTRLPVVGRNARFGGTKM
ncbi:hypothetical protein EXIGLDRAFT_780320 [Exidia glandulosa HHB12029]|uniref:Uncharacterized protein n=1 Tax=Exidia glandulosa HHB12029 TaxID=1314781 RepID=A0A165BNP5_EXIGL|nr:hypothetical protein EXIGLDRAFT_780320 [Exidia glandulosa HHB12029]